MDGKLHTFSSLNSKIIHLKSHYKNNGFLYKKCKCSFTKDVSFIKRNSFLSKNSKLSILLGLKDKISLNAIAKGHFVSITTVQRIMDHGYKALFVSKKTLPKILSSDEFKSTKDSLGAMSFIFMDAVNGKIIDIVENRQLNSLETYFSEFSFEAKKNVEYIVIDIYSPYITLIRRSFPNAKIIIDKFHILINRVLNKS